MLLTIPSNQTVEFDYPGYDLFEAELKNKSNIGLGVAVLSKDKNEQIKGFGLGKRAKVDVMVERDNKLVFTNTSNQDVKLRIDIDEAAPPQPTKDKYISFTLRNKSMKSIPLVIPTVMNPNLSPDSRSGVDLKVGQKIFFKVNRKKYLLLTVDESIENGSEIEVSEFIKKRKVELGV